MNGAILLGVVGGKSIGEAEDKLPSDDGPELEVEDSAPAGVTASVGTADWAVTDSLWDTETSGEDVTGASVLLGPALDGASAGTEVAISDGWTVVTVWAGAVDPSTGPAELDPSTGLTGTDPEPPAGIVVDSTPEPLPWTGAGNSPLTDDGGQGVDDPTVSPAPAPPPKI